jgi:hypothetical protein
MRLNKLDIRIAELSILITGPAVGNDEGLSNVYVAVLGRIDYFMVLGPSWNHNSA